MHVLRVRNVHCALPRGIDLLEAHGYEWESRNGPVLVMPEPVCTVYERPTERVVFWPSRDANPFFHLMESLWMLQGRNDVEFVTRFVKTMKNFSDDGRTFHGAYGHRWRFHFGRDQLNDVVQELKKDPNSRRAVVSMWDANVDGGGKSGKDFPCNIEAVFRINRHHQLDMTVFNRSNDMVWGAYGANAVHFSMLQEYMAARIGVPIGRYWQVANNFHAYLNTLEKVRHLNTDTNLNYPSMHDPYRSMTVVPYQIAEEPDYWDHDLRNFMEDPIGRYGYANCFFPQVAKPVYAAYMAHKERDYDAAYEIIAQCQASDWRRACTEWLQRRESTYLRAKDDGVSHD